MPLGQGSIGGRATTLKAPACGKPESVPEALDVTPAVRAAGPLRRVTARWLLSRWPRTPRYAHDSMRFSRA